MNMISLIAEPPEFEQFSGLERAAALMLALGKEYGAPIWGHLSAEEIKDLSACVARLGPVPAHVVEYILAQFSKAIAAGGTVRGSVDATERLLEGVLSQEQLHEVMVDIRGPRGRTTWDKLSNIPDNVLGAYLVKECPQTIAFILSKLDVDHAARLISELPHELAAEVVLRMLRTLPVQKEVLGEIDRSLQAEFLSNLTPVHRPDPHAAMADLFNALDGEAEKRLLGALDAQVPESAETIRSLMFTFDDLANLLPGAINVLVRSADKRIMALALKPASEELRAIFFSTMTERRSNLLRDEISEVGPVRLRDCHAAQATLVRLAKTLADRGEITLISPTRDGRLVY